MDEDYLDDELDEDSVPIGAFIYQYVMGNLHNIMIDLVAELDEHTGLRITTKESIKDRLMEIPNEGEENGNNEGTV